MTRNRQKSCKETENHSDIVKIHISSRTFAKRVGSALQHRNDDQPEFQILSSAGLSRVIFTVLLRVRSEHVCCSHTNVLQVICRMHQSSDEAMRQELARLLNLSERSESIVAHSH